MQVQFDTKIPKLKIKYTQKIIILHDLIQQNLSNQDWFLGWISEFSVGSRLGEKMSRTGVLFKPTLQTHPCNENRVPCNEKNRFFPVRKSSLGQPCFHYRDGFAVKIWLSKLLLWRKLNNSLDYKLCNQKKVNQPNKKKNINAVQDIRNICVHN